MAYDERLADRIRGLLEGEPDLTERKMFGGLAFLIGGNMAVAASGQGGALVRVDPARSDQLVATTTARPRMPSLFGRVPRTTRSPTVVDSGSIARRVVSTAPVVLFVIETRSSPDVRITRSGSGISGA